MSALSKKVGLMPAILGALVSCAGSSGRRASVDANLNIDLPYAGETGSSPDARIDDGPQALDGQSLVPDQKSSDPEKTYWVTPTGTAPWSGTGACKGATPLADTEACGLATANKNAGPGDTVILRDGTYAATLAPAKNGTATDRLTFVGHTGEKPRISGVGTGIFLDGRSYITIDGLTVDGCDKLASMHGAEHVWIYRSALINSPDRGNYPNGFVMTANSHYNRLIGCTLGSVGYMSPTNDEGYVMDLGYCADDDPTCTRDTTSHNWIEGNTFYHGGHHLIEVSAHHNIIRNNTFHNEDWTPCSRASTNNLCGNRSIIIYGKGTRNVIEGNRFGFTGASIDDELGSCALSVRAPDNIIRRNLFFYSGGPGVDLVTDADGSYESSNNYIYQNVFYKNGVSPLSTSSATYGLVFDNWSNDNPPLPIVHVSVINNLFHADVGGSVFFSHTDDKKQIIKGNFWSLVTGSSGASIADNITSLADPLFTDISAAGVVENIAKFDFRLKAGSPAIDKGVFLTHAVADGSGVILKVADASFFMDGYGMTDGDLVQLEETPLPVRVRSIDYGKNELTLEEARTWKTGEGVAQPYSGSAPDIGAYETASP